MLRRKLSGRETEALLTSTAGPPVASKVETPAPTVTRVPVPAPVLTAPAPVMRTPAPPSAKTSRSVKARSPETLASTRPPAPTPLPEAPITVVPPETVW